MTFRGLALVAALATLACYQDNRPSPQGYLFEKGKYQATYGPDGRIMRLLYDGNGDRKAEIVTLFHPNGKARTSEVDSDLDGVVDRWEFYKPNGELEKIGSSNLKPGVPDVWEYYDKAQQLVRRERDLTGDGRVDRVRSFERGQLVGMGVDSDQDGRFDRWQSWREGRLVTEEVDTDGDGAADRRLRFGPSGEVERVEVLGRRN